MPRIFFVLSQCKNAGNMGATARAIKNMGIDGLILIQPNREQWLEGIKMAPGAEDILEEASLFDSLSEAVLGMHLVIGTTRRPRKNRFNTFTPRDIFTEIIALPSDFAISVVFGSERNGLTNCELSLCQKIVIIPTSPQLPSINLAQAVMIMAYEWHMASFVTADQNYIIQNSLPNEVYAISEHRQRLIGHINQVIKKIGFVEKHSEPNIMTTLIDILSRIDLLTEREVAILRGILSKIEYCIDKNP